MLLLSNMYRSPDSSLLTWWWNKNNLNISYCLRDFKVSHLLNPSRTWFPFRIWVKQILVTKETIKQMKKSLTSICSISGIIHGQWSSCQFRYTIVLNALHSDEALDIVYFTNWRSVATLSQSIDTIFPTASARCLPVSVSHFGNFCSSSNFFSIICYSNPWLVIPLMLLL